MKHFPKDWLPILLLIAMIAYSVTVEVIEDGTPEEEDMVKALALSKRFFWRSMMENWECNDEKVALGQVEKRANSNRLRQICERWKVKALATDAFLKSWESNKGASSSSSSANIPNDQIKVEKPLFRVAGGRELQLSSAMEAIKAAYRVLFGWRSAAGFDTVFDFVNTEYLHINNAQKISPKGKLNQLNFEEEMENGQKRKYLKEYYNKQKNLVSKAKIKYKRPLDVKMVNAFKKGNKMEKKIEKEKGTVNETLIDDKYKQIEDFTEKNECFLEYWDSVQELGLDMEMTCKKVIEIKTKYEANLAKMMVDDYVWHYKDIMIGSELLYRLAVPNTKKLHLERFVGEVFFNYIHLIRDPMMKKYPDELEELKPLLDPCEEAKLKVKKTEGSSSG